MSGRIHVNIGLQAERLICLPLCVCYFRVQCDAACCTHVRWSKERAAGVCIQEKSAGAALVNAVKASRALRCAAVLDEQRQLQDRGSVLAPSGPWRALQLEPHALPEAIVWLAVLVGLGPDYQLGLGDARVVKDAVEGAAMALAADIAAKLSALRRLWQPVAPQVSGDGSRPLSPGQSQVSPAEQQLHLQQNACKARLAVAAAAIGAAAPSSRKADGIQHLAICTQLPSELGLLTAVQNTASSVKDPSDSSQQQTLEVFLRNALMSLTYMVKMLAMPGQVAVPALAAACAHTKLPPVLQGTWQGTAGAALCAGDGCDGSGYGIPLLFKLSADLCSAAAAAPVEAREKRQQLCEEFINELQNVLSAMGGGWIAARPPPPQWPPTEAEEAAATAKAGTTAAAQAASDAMMRLLLEVQLLPAHDDDACRDACTAMYAYHNGVLCPMQFSYVSGMILQEEKSETTAGTSKKQRKKARLSHRQAAAAATAQTAASADTSTAGPSPSKADEAPTSAMAEPSAGPARAMVRAVQSDEHSSGPSRTVPQPQIDHGPAHHWMLCPLSKVLHQTSQQTPPTLLHDLSLQCVLVFRCLPAFSRSYKDSECKQKMLCHAIGVLLP